MFASGVSTPCEIPPPPELFRRGDGEGSGTIDIGDPIFLLQLLFDNDPALGGVPLFDNGGTQIGDVLVPSNELDTFLTISLVIKL